MKNSYLYIIVAIPVFLLSGCIHVRPVATPANSFDADSEIAQFAALLSGSYSNQEQAQSDTSFLHVNMTLTPVWLERPDGIWIYAEQALAADPDNPYRQRIYRLTHPTEYLFLIDTYTITDAHRFTGLHKDISKSRHLTFDQVDMIAGCTVSMRYHDGVYRGGSQGRECASDFRGATHVMTNVTIESGKFYSWDRGYDAAGNQVWGPVYGGYEFVKKAQ